MTTDLEADALVLGGGPAGTWAAVAAVGCSKPAPPAVSAGGEESVAVTGDSRD